VTASIALLGLGEAGSEIARDLVAAGADVRGYDPKGILVTGVAVRISEADAVRDAGLVLSVNSGHDAQTALVNALGSLRPDTIWADLNTAAPGVKAALVRQLLRSVFYKGLAAAVVEALTAARAAGCEPWLATKISAELTGFDEQTIIRLVEGTHQHARRRADEMGAAAEQLAELGIPPRIAAAARDLLIELRDSQSQELP
jgi:3-hydroxyisobutyrate dehydrogenase-like beta-hydroxyacid dehydrogenase